jgi:hypothetical protein
MRSDIRAYLVIAACSGPPARPIENTVEHAGALRPACDLGIWDLGALEDRVRAAVARGARAIGTCALVANERERWDVRERGELVAEVIFTNGIVAYTDRVTWDGLTIVASPPEGVLTALPGPMQCGGAIRLPDEITAKYPVLSSCAISPPARYLRYTVVGTTPEIERGEDLSGAAAVRFFRGTRIVAFELYRGD